MIEPDSHDTDRAAALIERLLEVEERLHGLVRENLKLQRDLASGPSHRSGGQAFEPPRTTHDWPLAADASLRPEDLDLYDRRCDDEVVMAGRSGTAFLERFDLLGAEPDFAGAVAAIRAAAAEQRHLGARRGRRPDVSIVIPAYGQLGYTLNCVHSLITHGTRHRMEIIVIDDASPDRSDEFLPQLPCVRYYRNKANGGFVRSCNVGGQLATGRFLVLLNNDTRVSKGWLDMLV